MGFFYHPFKEKGNEGKTYLLNENEDTILITGKDSQSVYPIINGTVLEIKEDSIIISSTESGYSKQTDKSIEITYGHITPQSSLTINTEVTPGTLLGTIKKEGDDTSPYLTLSFKSDNKGVDVTSLYQKNKDIVPNYETLRKKGLVTFDTNTSVAVNGSYSKMIFVQQPKYTVTSGATNGEGIAAIALTELLDMIVKPQLYTGYSNEGLGGTVANKYQKAAGIGLNVPWCVAFVSYCANIGGFVSSGLYPSASLIGCANTISSFEDIGNPTKDPLNYTPVSGDLVFFNWGGSDIDHIGIVYMVTNEGIFTIEGNSTRTPQNFADTVNMLPSSDLIVTTMNSVLNGKTYTDYVREQYSNANMPFYSEINGVSLLFYPFSDGAIAKYIHMQ